MKASLVETKLENNHTSWIRLTVLFLLFGVLIVFIRSSNQITSLFLNFTDKLDIPQNKLNTTIFDLTTQKTQLLPNITLKIQPTLETTTKTTPKTTPKTTTKATTKTTLKTTTLPPPNKPPLIVFWNKPFKRFPSYFPFDFCYPNNDCKIEYTSKNAAEADVVVIHPLFSANLPPNPNKIYKNITNFRRNDQLFVFFQWESPEYHHDFVADKRTDLRVYDDFFDLTMTYRNDSGVKFPYGSAVTVKLMLYYEKRSVEEVNYHEPVRIEKLTENDVSRYFQDYRIDFGSKQADVIAVVSNCGSEYRGNWIKSLDKSFKKHGVNFHVYGHCAKVYQPNRNGKNMTITNGAQKYTLLPDVIKKFKFYLAIENSRCVDYITEKIFHNAYLSNAVPIVAGSVKANYENWLPSDSFIHLDDFEDSDKVAEYVKSVLDGGEQRYLEYFDWLKRDARLENYQFATKTDFSENYGWCKLCRLAKMRNEENGAGISSKLKPNLSDSTRISDVHTWWYGSRDKLVRDGPEKVCDKVRNSDESLVPGMLFDGGKLIKNDRKN